MCFFVFFLFAFNSSRKISDQQHPATSYDLNLMSWFPGYNWNKTETKVKQNKRKTTFCFSEIVLFQFRFSVFTRETKRCNKTKVGVAYSVDWRDAMNTALCDFWYAAP